MTLTIPIWHLYVFLGICAVPIVVLIACFVWIGWKLLNIEH